jgi:hypothetical protein
VDAGGLEGSQGGDVTLHYRLGWNDRVAKTAEDYGKAYRANDGTLMANASCASTWTQEERAEYVRGWDDASTKIASLAIPETDG